MRGPTLKIIDRFTKMFDDFYQTLATTTDSYSAATTRTIRAQATASGVLISRPKKSEPDALSLKEFFDRLAQNGWYRKRVQNRTVLPPLPVMSHLYRWDITRVARAARCIGRRERTLADVQLVSV